MWGRLITGVLALLARRGPAVRCAACGGVLFRGPAWVSRGEVKLLGADEALVAVDFSTTGRLALRHVDLTDCRAEAGRR